MNEPTLGIDPGTMKVGYAVTIDAGSPALEMGIATVDQLAAAVAELFTRHPIGAIALGRGTNASHIERLLASFEVPIHLIDERETSLRARAAYYADHPPRGWRRLIPLGLQVPPCPIDDYAALLIARRYLDLKP
ncbi:MAG: pre-16S rRNA-processing nuclease YqgF [Candidatus Baltobacteraceae bacterium]